jgi:hypothetical protein
MVANLPPVSTTPTANFFTSFASVVDTGGKFATGVVYKMNLKKKFICMLTLLPKGVQNKS